MTTDEQGSAEHAGATPDSGLQHRPEHGHHYDFPIKLRIFAELKRRNLVRVAILYLVACYVILEPTHLIFFMLEVPVWLNRAVIVLMVAAFPLVMLFSWIYEITPGGIKPTAEVNPTQSITGRTAQKLNRAIIVVLALAVAYFVADKFWLSKHLTSSGREQTASTEVTGSAKSVSPEGTSKSIPIGDKSIAVLPFVDMSEKKDQEFFADGMAEEVIDLLSKVPGIKVIGRTSSFQFKSKADDLREIGAKLGARYVVDGSVRKTDDRVRISAQLIGTGDGVQRWSKSYDRPIRDVLKLQDDISSDLVRELQLSVSTDSIRSRAALKNVEAYNLFLRGLRLIDQGDKDAFEAAAKYLQQAIAIDPTFAPAIAELAYVRDAQAEFGYIDTPIGYQEARAQGEKALSLDPTLALPHCILGNYYAQYAWDWKNADLEFQKALALDPSDAMTLWMNARFAVEVGKWSAAEQFVNASLAMDPLNPVAHFIAGNIWFRIGRLSDSAVEYRQALEISPTYISAHFNLGKTEMLMGHLDAALAAMNGESPEPSSGRAAGLAMVYQAMGRTKEANNALAQLIKESSSDWPYGIAQVYASWQNADETLKWLERAYAAKDELHFLNGDPLFRFLQGNPGFKAFLQKMNLP